MLTMVFFDASIAERVSTLDHVVNEQIVKQSVPTMNTEG